MLKIDNTDMELFQTRLARRIYLRLLRWRIVSRAFVHSQPKAAFFIFVALAIGVFVAVTKALLHPASQAMERHPLLSWLVHVLIYAVPDICFALLPIAGLSYLFPGVTESLRKHPFVRVVLISIFVIFGLSAVFINAITRVSQEKLEQKQARKIEDLLVLVSDSKQMLIKESPFLNDQEKKEIDKRLSLIDERVGELVGSGTHTETHPPHEPNGSDSSTNPQPNTIPSYSAGILESPELRRDKDLLLKFAIQQQSDLTSARIVRSDKLFIDVTFDSGETRPYLVQWSATIRTDPSVCTALQADPSQNKPTDGRQCHSEIKCDIVREVFRIDRGNPVRFEKMTKILYASNDKGTDVPERLYRGMLVGSGFSSLVTRHRVDTEIAFYRLIPADREQVIAELGKLTRVKRAVVDSSSQ